VTNLHFSLQINVKPTMTLTEDSCKQTPPQSIALTTACG